jgi:hypothetical protein
MQTLDATKPGLILHRGTIGYRWKKFGASVGTRLIPTSNFILSTPMWATSGIKTFDEVRVAILFLEWCIGKYALRVDLLLFFGEQHAVKHAAGIDFVNGGPLSSKIPTVDDGVLTGDNDGAQ